MVCLQLLHNGANPFFEDSDGRTPLHLAAKAGNAIGIKLLFDYTLSDHVQERFFPTVPTDTNCIQDRTDRVSILLKEFLEGVF